MWSQSAQLGHKHAQWLSAWQHNDCDLDWRGMHEHIQRGCWQGKVVCQCVDVCVKVYMSLPLLSVFSHKQISSFENEWANVSKHVYLITFAHSDPQTYTHTHTYVGIGSLVIIALGCWPKQVWSQTGVTREPQRYWESWCPWAGLLTWARSRGIVPVINVL